MDSTLKAALLAILPKTLRQGKPAPANSAEFFTPEDANTLINAEKANTLALEAAEADVASLKASRTADEAIQANHQTAINQAIADITSLKNSRTNDESAIAALPGFYPLGLGVDPNTLTIPAGYVFADDGTNLWIRRPGETGWSTRSGGSTQSGTLAFTAQPQLKVNSVTSNGWAVRYLYQDGGTPVTVEQQLINGGPWTVATPSWVNGAWEVVVTGQTPGTYAYKIRLTEGVNTVVSNPVTVNLSLPTSTLTATSITSTLATFTGVPTLPTQGTVQKHRVAFQKVGTDASPDAAVAAGRYVDIAAPADITAFAGAGITKSITLDGGAQYLFSVQTTALCGDGVTSVTGGWTTGNAATVDALPTASGVSMDAGPYAVGANIPGHYTYSDLDGQPESGTIFKHYRGIQANGSDRLLIAGAATLDYVAQSADAGLYVFLGVTPADASGTGVEVISAPVTVAPQALTGLSVAPGKGQNVISCNAGLAGATYNLYRSTVAGVTKLNGAKIPNVTFPYTDPSLTNGQTYYYIATQIGVNGVESADSTQASGTPVSYQILYDARSGGPDDWNTKAVDTQWGSVGNAVVTFDNNGLPQNGTDYGKITASPPVGMGTRAMKLAHSGSNEWYLKAFFKSNVITKGYIQFKAQYKSPLGAVHGWGVQDPSGGWPRIFFQTDGNIRNDSTGGGTNKLIQGFSVNTVYTLKTRWDFSVNKSLYVSVNGGAEVEITDADAGLWTNPASVDTFFADIAWATGEFWLSDLVIYKDA